MKVKLEGQTLMIDDKRIDLAHIPFNGAVNINGVVIKDGEEVEI